MKKLSDIARRWNKVRQAAKMAKPEEEQLAWNATLGWACGVVIVGVVLWNAFGGSDAVPSVSAEAATIAQTQQDVPVSNPVKPQGGAPKPAGTQVRIWHRKSQMDGERWAFLVIPARESYQDMMGLSIRPELVVQCAQTGDEPTMSGWDTKVSLRLDHIGPLENGDMRLKLDDADAREVGFSRLADGSTYTMYHDQALLEDVLSAKKMLIEFEPFMTASKSIARFDVSGLRREFDKASECRGDPAVIK
jgi:hypothetical protein